MIEIYTGHYHQDGVPLRYLLDGLTEVALKDIIQVDSGPLYLFGVSGGKDSGALLLWALYESGLPHDRIVVTCADTGNEHVVTYLQIDKMNAIHPVMMLKPELDFWGLVEAKGLFPSRRRRFCTEYLKMQPAQRFAMALVSAGYDVTMYSGVRADESDERGKLPEKEWDPYFALPVVRPLLGWSISQVVAIHEKYKLPLNPLYSWGARRVGCFPCINSVKSELRVLSAHAPEQIEKIDRYEKKFFETAKSGGGFFHRNTVPKRFRTQPHVSKKGEMMMVASIHDIVRWSQWESKYDLAKARKIQDARNQTTLFSEDKHLGCNSSMGYCE